MTAVAVLHRPTPEQNTPTRTGTPAVAYQRVLHQLVRRELRVLAELSARAPADDTVRTHALTRHADLIGRVLLQHHATEHELVWPALLNAMDDVGATRDDVANWAIGCAVVDQMLRDAGTAARQWAVACSVPARDAFARACRKLADAVAEQTAEEEDTLLPLLATHLSAADWVAVTRSAHGCLTARERLLVLGLALEDASPGDRARLIGGLSPATRRAWRLHGGRRYRAAVVRLRGEPPAI